MIRSPKSLPSCEVELSLPEILNAGLLLIPWWAPQTQIPSPATKDLVQRHRAHSEYCRDIYKECYTDIFKNEENDAEWLDCVEWVKHKYELEKKELRTEIFTAGGIIKGLENELDSNLEDYQADLDCMKEERDEAEEKLELRNQQLRNIGEQKRKAQAEVKTAKKEIEKLHKELEASRRQTVEAEGNAEDLKTGLQQANEEIRMLCSANATAWTIFEQRSQINHLQAVNQHLEHDKVRIAESLDSAIATNNQQAEMAALSQGLAAAHNQAIAMENRVFEYQASRENQPELTAHLDGLLKLKDEVNDDLRARYQQCAEQRMESEKMRAIDREHFLGVRAELQRDLATQKEEIGGLKDCREKFRWESEQIRELFARKIFKDDVVEVINAEHEALKNDNAFLISMVGAREAHVKEAMAKLPPLEVKIIELESAMEKSQAKQTELQAEVNGLTTRKGDLEVARDLQEIALNVRQEDLDKAEAEKQRLEAILRESPPSSP